MTTGDEVVLEGGSRHGQPAPFAAMRRLADGEYVLDDPAGVYRHLAEDRAYLRDGYRVAIFEPTAPGNSQPAA